MVNFQCMDAKCQDKVVQTTTLHLNLKLPRDLTRDLLVAFGEY